MNYWIVWWCLVTIWCGWASGRGGGSRRMLRLEKNVQQLARAMKRAEQRRMEDIRILKALASAPEEFEMVKATVAALEAESRALSQFDSQFRSLQEALNQMIQRKDQQTEAYQLFRQELLLIRYALHMTQYNESNRFGNIQFDHVNCYHSASSFIVNQLVTL